MERARRRAHGWRGRPAAVMLVVSISAWGLAAGEEPRADPDASRAPAYRIGKEDILQVTVFGEETLSVPRIPVRPDGRISLPLLGDVVAMGETPEGLAAKLTEMYKAHVRAPAVTVMVVEVNSFKVYVLGNVGSPGALNFGRETTLLQALALAGGLSQFANTRRIVVIRDDGGKPRRMEINYEKIVSGQELQSNLRLKPGDTIVVP